jgi:myo-inositol-1(or 4)-monophosphatase
VTPPPSEDDLLDLARRAAGAAAAELLSRFRGEALGVRSKSTPTDPVSEADLAAERAVRDLLGRERPGDRILGEEGGATDGSGPDAMGDTFLWVVDPLDGTVNYLYGSPSFAVSLACEDGEGAVAAVVLDPVSGECFAATRSGPATLDGLPLWAGEPRSLAEALVGTGFAYDRDVRAAQAEVAARVLPRARDIRRVGAAALDLCWCAAGRLDAFYERGVHHWDVAAGALICRRAGREVRDLPEVAVEHAGRPVTLPSGILVAPPNLADELERLVGARQ